MAQAGFGRRVLLISPGRNEAKFLRRTLDSVIAQSERPALWIIVDDGSTDQSPELLAGYAADHAWIRVIRREDRGRRAVGPGVIEAFYDGLAAADLNEFDYICKLDLDLDLPGGYFAGLMDRMEAEPRLGSCSGKAYYRASSGAMVSENISDEVSVGASKFYRRTCFQQIGGFAREVMWDGIDCHKSRQLGWTVRSWDDPELRFEHLRPMGSSQSGILTGRKRHGFGQHYMGSDWAFILASGVFRMAQRPFLIGGLAMLWGFLSAKLKGAPQHADRDLIAFIRRYQRRALIVGKAKAVAEIEAANASVWRPPA